MGEGEKRNKGTKHAKRGLREKGPGCIKATLTLTPGNKSCPWVLWRRVKRGVGGKGGVGDH